jgi:hypothetical protein
MAKHPTRVAAARERRTANGEGGDGPVAATSAGAGGEAGSSSATDSSSPTAIAGTGPDAPSASTTSNTGGTAAIGGASGAPQAVGGLGAGGSGAQTCEDGALQCNAESGLREQCEHGAWVPTDFVCARSIRVDSNDGATCAVKADGTFRCWAIGGSQIATDAVAPPGVLRSAYPFGSNTVTWLLADGAFVDV